VPEIGERVCYGMTRAALEQLIASKYSVVSEQDTNHRMYNVYQAGLSWLGHIHRSLDFKREVNVFLVEQSGLGAFAARHDGEYLVVLPTGIYDFATVTYEEYFDKSEFDDTDYIASNENFSELFFLFVLFHEYMHVVNGHLDYLKRNPNASDEIYRALEYNADNFATIMTYKIMRHMASDTEEDDLFRLLTTAVYWPFRKLMSLHSLSQSQSRHPKFSTRIQMYSIQALAIDNMSGGKIANDEVSDRRSKIIRKALNANEAHFLGNDESEGIQTFIDAVFGPEGEAFLEGRECVKTWWEIKEEVMRLEEAEVIHGGEELDWHFKDGRFSVGWNG